MKGLIIDSVDRAQSGHPGGAMASMDFAYILFSEYLSFDPEDPQWLGRDRFVLSAGHESMLAYSLLYAVGWLNLDDGEGLIIKNAHGEFSAIDELFDEQFVRRHQVDG